jgi:hypothetical protein
MIVVKHILRYLRCTAMFGLHFLSAPSTVLAAFSDADWLVVQMIGNPRGDMLYSFDQI